MDPDILGTDEYVRSVRLNSNDDLTKQASYTKSRRLQAQVSRQLTARENKKSKYQTTRTYRKTQYDEKACVKTHNLRGEQAHYQHLRRAAGKESLRCWSRFVDKASNLIIRILDWCRLSWRIIWLVSSIRNVKIAGTVRGFSSNFLELTNSNF